MLFFISRLILDAALKSWQPLVKHSISLIVWPEIHFNRFIKQLSAAETNVLAAIAGTALL